MMSFHRIFVISALSMVISSCISGTAPAPAGVQEDDILPLVGDYIVIDTSRRTLTVFLKDKAVRAFDRIALGSAGAGIKDRNGDDITPLGRFKIASVKPSQKYNFFIELDYPSLAYAKRAFNGGRIDKKTFDAIKNALKFSRTPPQDTSIGGHIGIHGLGKGSPEIHKISDWTRGCVALDNHQIQDLVTIIRPGMVVDIRK